MSPRNGDKRSWRQTGLARELFRRGTGGKKNGDKSERSSARVYAQCAGDAVKFKSAKIYNGRCGRAARSN